MVTHFDGLMTVPVLSSRAVEPENESIYACLLKNASGKNKKKHPEAEVVKYWVIQLKQKRN